MLVVYLGRSFSGCSFSLIVWWYTVARSSWKMTHHTCMSVTLYSIRNKNVSWQIIAAPAPGWDSSAVSHNSLSPVPWGCGCGFMAGKLCIRCAVWHSGGTKSPFSPKWSPSWPEEAKIFIIRLFMGKSANLYYSPLVLHFWKPAFYLYLGLRTCPWDKGLTMDGISAVVPKTAL